jgi:hypothetical protein
MNYIIKLILILLADTQNLATNIDSIYTQLEPGNLIVLELNNKKNIRGVNLSVLEWQQEIKLLTVKGIKKIEKSKIKGISIIQDDYLQGLNDGYSDYLNADENDNLVAKSCLFPPYYNKSKTVLPQPPDKIANIEAYYDGYINGFKIGTQRNGIGDGLFACLGGTAWALLVFMLTSSSSLF